MKIDELQMALTQARSKPQSPVAADEVNYWAKDEPWCASSYEMNK